MDRYIYIDRLEIVDEFEWLSCEPYCCNQLKGRLSIVEHWRSGLRGFRVHHVNDDGDPGPQIPLAERAEIGNSSESSRDEPGRERSRVHECARLNVSTQKRLRSG